MFASWLKYKLDQYLLSDSSINPNNVSFFLIINPINIYLLLNSKVDQTFDLSKYWSKFTFWHKYKLSLKRKIIN